MTPTTLVRKSVLTKMTYHSKAQPPKVTSEVAARIRARETEALAAGWSWELLWETRVWNIGTDGKNRTGLAALLRAGYDIGKITENHIEITTPSGLVHRFYHPDKEQPWIVTAGA